MSTTLRDGDPFVGAVNFLIDVLETSEYTNDPDDAGGETHFGISKRAHPAVDIRNLTRDRAISIYHEDYWRPSRCDILPLGLSLQWFAAYVNMRPQSAVRCLQRAVTRVVVDGVLGPKTIAAVQQFRPQRELRACFSRECVEHYLAIVRKHPPQVKYQRGWIGRVCRVADEAGAWGESE